MMGGVGVGVIVGAGSGVKVGGAKVDISNWTISTVEGELNDGDLFKVSRVFRETKPAIRTPTTVTPTKPITHPGHFGATN